MSRANDGVTLFLAPYRRLSVAHDTDRLPVN